MSTCNVHNVRFYKPKPKAVYCMAVQQNQSKLAVSRSDANIEIWNLNFAPFIERTIPSSVENWSVEGLAWCGDRLFSVGLHGLLIEYDLFKLNIKNSLAVTGEAAFCLDVNESGKQIALGTEQGYINIFNINNNEMLFNKFLDKQEGRVLCLKYSQNGEFIVSGGIDAIRIWSVNTGHALHRMTTGRSEANKPTIVWCLEVTDDFTIISGDSRGKLTFWDGKIGAQLESSQSHRADILALCLSEDQTSLFCGGVDPNITNYVRITVKDGAQKWVKSIQRKIHEHDVRALALVGSKLYSSGADGYLACSYHPPKTLSKYPPILQNSCISLAQKPRYIMLQYQRFIEIWSLGTGNNKDEHSGMFTLEKVNKKLLVLKKIAKDSEGVERKENIICSAISNDGKYIMFSTIDGVRVFRFIYNENEKPELTRLPFLKKDCSSCINAVFTPNNQLVVATSDEGLKIFEIENDCLVFKQNVDSSQLEDIVSHLKTSFCGKYLIAGDPRSNILIWIMKNDKFVFHSKLPKYRAAPTALGVHPKLPQLVVAYADSNIVEYDFKNKQLSQFSRKLAKDLPQQWSIRHYPFRNVAFHPNRENVIIVHDDSNIIVLGNTKESPKGKAKIRKTDKNTPEVSNQFHSIKKYKHLVYLDWLAEDEMIAVEVRPLSLIEQLPPCLVQSTFGKK